MMILSPSVPLSPSTHQYAVWGGTFGPLDLWGPEEQAAQLPEPADLIISALLTGVLNIQYLKYIQSSS